MGIDYTICAIMSGPYYKPGEHYSIDLRPLNLPIVKVLGILVCGRALIIMNCSISWKHMRVLLRLRAG